MFRNSTFPRGEGQVVGLKYHLRAHALRNSRKISFISIWKLPGSVLLTLAQEKPFFYLRSVYVFLRHTEVFIGRWMRLAFSLSKTEKNFFIASAMKRVGAKYFGRCSFISIFVYLVEGKAWSKGNNYFPPVSLACCARLFLGNGHNGPYKSDPCQRPPSLRDLSKLPCSLPAWTPYLEECASSIYRWNVLLKGSDRQGVEARQVYLKRVRGSQV